MASNSVSHKAKENTEKAINKTKIAYEQQKSKVLGAQDYSSYKTAVHGQQVILELAKILAEISKTELMSSKQKEYLEAFQKDAKGEDSWTLTWVLDQIIRLTPRIEKKPITNSLPYLCMELLAEVISATLPTSLNAMKAAIDGAAEGHHAQTKKEAGVLKSPAALLHDNINETIYLQDQLINLVSILDEIVITKVSTPEQIKELQRIGSQFVTPEAIVCYPEELVQDIIELTAPKLVVKEKDIEEAKKPGIIKNQGPSLLIKSLF